jgi:hypothetical protein
MGHYGEQRLVFVLINTFASVNMHHPLRFERFLNVAFKFLLRSSIGVGLIGCLPSAASAAPFGTWLSKPQIAFHTSNNTLSYALAQIKAQEFKVVFLDYRNVPDALQQEVSEAVRQQFLMPVVWVQSPQFRSLTVPQLLAEARNGDGIQVDDHFFSNYSLTDFYALRSSYAKPIFCSIQPFQAAKVPPKGCNHLDVQCYSSNGFRSCLNLAGRLNAATSLSAQQTFQYRTQMTGRRFNVFLWPYSNSFLR